MPEFLPALSLELEGGASEAWLLRPHRDSGTGPLLVFADVVTLLSRQAHLQLQI